MRNKVTAESYTDQLVEDLKDPIEAAAYLQAAIEEAGYTPVIIAAPDSIAAAAASPKSGGCCCASRKAAAVVVTPQQQ